MPLAAHELAARTYAALTFMCTCSGLHRDSYALMAEQGLPRYVRHVRFVHKTGRVCTARSVAELGYTVA